MNYFVLILGTALATWALLYPARGCLRRAGVVDRPNGRSSHTIPTVRGGGVAIVIVIALFLGGLSLLSIEVIAADAKGIEQVAWTPFAPRLALLLAAFVVLAVISFVDDMRGLPAKVRFSVHAAAAIAAVWTVTTDSAQPMTTVPATVCLAVIAVVWIAGYTNAFNFMDGINGIAGMQALFSGIGTAVVAIKLGIPTAHTAVMLAWITAGAALGFLPHNFPRARVFMGDVSSAPLGFLLASLAFWTAALTSWWVLFWIALLHANFVLDTGITLIRRAFRGDRLHEAHREHFYQRLVRAGYSHTLVTFSEAAIQVFVVLAVWRATLEPPVTKIVVAAGVVGVWLAYFGFAEVKFRKSSAVHLALTGGR